MKWKMNKKMEGTMKKTEAKGLMAHVKEWCDKMYARSKYNRSCRRAAAMVRESELRVQIREYDGEMYLALDGVPVLPADGIVWDLPTAVAVSREVWTKYHLDD